MVIADSIDLRIDGSDHASLTMHPLGAVVPDWLGVHDTDGVSQQVSGSNRSGVGGHEARVESIRLVRHDVLDRHTWLVKSRLHDGVVLLNY